MRAMWHSMRSPFRCPDGVLAHASRSRPRRRARGWTTPATPCTAACCRRCASASSRCAADVCAVAQLTSCCGLDFHIVFIRGWSHTYQLFSNGATESCNHADLHAVRSWAGLRRWQPTPPPCRVVRPQQRPAAGHLSMRRTRRWMRCSGCCWPWSRCSTALTPNPSRRCDSWRSAPLATCSWRWLITRCL